MEPIVVIGCTDAGNIGDFSTPPTKYFDLGPWKWVYIADIERQPDAIPQLDNARIILGGGGLFHGIWMPALDKLFNHYAPKSLVLWGVGLNTHCKTTDDSFPEWASRADLIGVRDYEKGLPWVPCPSCMSPAFDIERRPEHPFVIYDHRWSPVPIDIPGAPRSGHRMHRTIDSALDFLGSGEVVLTSTYHGVYWATLLGRRVIAWPFASRFYAMRHPPVLLQEGEPWEDRLGEAQAYPEALAQCRAANLKHYEKAWKILS